MRQECKRSIKKFLFFSKKMETEFVNWFSPHEWCRNNKFFDDEEYRESLGFDF